MVTSSSGGFIFTGPGFQVGSAASAARLCSRGACLSASTGVATAAHSAAASRIFFIVCLLVGGSVRRRLEQLGVAPDLQLQPVAQLRSRDEVVVLAARVTGRL